jgi:UDP-glucose 4-epimerase
MFFGIPKERCMKTLDDYQGQTCVVTGGASFIGSTLVDHLATTCKRVVVIDDFSSGRRENLSRHVDSDVVEVLEGDLADREFALEAIEPCDVVFHLAAVHGGRGFIERFPAAMLTNFAIDFNVLHASLRAQVPRLVHTSSACAYPVGLQSSEDGRGLLEESQAGFDSAAQSFPDGTYGWIKLMGEYQFKVAAEAEQISCRSARVFTAC